MTTRGFLRFRILALRAEARLRADDDVHGDEIRCCSRPNEFFHGFSDAPVGLCLPPRFGSEVSDNYDAAVDFTLIP